MRMSHVVVSAKIQAWLGLRSQTGVEFNIIADT